MLFIVVFSLALFLALLFTPAAKRLADHVIFLYLGELVEQGPAEEFFNRPKQELTREYLKGIIS